MQAGDEALERRIVTVLFADLVGFTSLAEQFDAEDVAVIQDRYFETVRETIGRYNGRIEKFIGDAAMAVFGVPTVRDDDAERAVRAGMALIHGVQHLGAELGLDESLLQLRVGINTGEAVVAASGADEGRITGDTINTAARLQTAAPIGSVLVGESTALRVAEVAEFGDQLHLDLKGKSVPVTARVATGFRTESSRELAMGSLRAPTVGRQAELHALGEALQGAVDGAVERWMIVAPPGVGKSRLLRDIAVSAERRQATAVWRSRSRAGAVSPFDAIAGLLVAALGTNSDSAKAEQTLRERLAGDNVPGPRADVVAATCLALVWPDDGTAAMRAPKEDRDALFAAWLDGLDALAYEATQVWLVEDVHWAGGDVLAFLDLAGSRAARNGRLVIATARPSLLEARPEWARERPGFRMLRLSTLEPTDARSLVKELVGDALPASLVDRIVERSDGNCLFIEELLRTWVSVGAIVPDAAGSVWSLAAPADEIPLPQSVQQIYAAQLDDLPPESRRLARRASVAGRRFPVKALGSLGVGGGGLESLRRRELVTGPLSEPLLGDAFAYRHALLRDAGYASLARAERAHLHARLARWLEQAAGTRSAEVAEQIAGHYEAALESAPALAATVDDDLDRAGAQRKAADWYERAAQTALSLSAHEAARQLLRRAIDLTKHSDVLDLARRWERLADATAFAADMTEGAAAYQKAIDLYRAALSDGRPHVAIEGLSRATTSLCFTWYEQLRFDEALELASRTIEELGDADATSRARLLMVRGQNALGARGPSALTRDDLETAVRLADEGDDDALKLQTREILTVLRSESGTDELESWEAIADEAFRVGNVRMGISATQNAAFYKLDDAPRAIVESLERARELAVAHGLTEEIGWIDYLRAEHAFVSGDWQRALQLCSAVMDLGEANAYLRVTVRTIHVVVPIASVRGDREALERAARWYKSLEGKFDFPDSPYSRVIRVAQDLELADNELWSPYVPDVEPRIASFSEAPDGPSWSTAMDRVLRAWVEEGDLDGADRALDATAGAIAKSTVVSSLAAGTYLLMRARVTLARGDRSAASTLATKALSAFRTSDAPWWKAKAIRLLERAGAADQALVAEVEQIENKLGALGSTP